ncbi:MAG: response regulator [Anaerolineales bacterium]|jgi:DNA-binding NtrC family response regulator|nr:response regulator [Anaerolineales bacterium]
MPKILIVDDEAAVARSMQKTLMRAGYEVETAPSCDEGWQTLQASPKSFDLVLLDLNMPGFGGSPATDAGLDLLERIQETWPALPALILSAYDDPARASEATRRGARGFSVKGREQNVLEQIQSILSGDPS